MAPPQEPATQWRRAVPVIAGWYWWRSSRDAPVSVVNVLLRDGTLCVTWPYTDTPVGLFGGEWSGPLYPPN